MMLKNYGKYIFLILFACFIWGYSLADMLAPPRDYSELENRKLAFRPTFSSRSLLRNAYTLEYETFINDQFLHRDGWITVKSVSEAALGKTENNGIVYGKHHYMFEKALLPDDYQLKRNLQFVREFAEMYPERGITLTIVPSSYAILEEYLPDHLHNIDQLSAIAHIYEAAEAAGIRTLDASAPLRSASGAPGYLYYRTDHHWTTGGAYLVYGAYIRSRGLQPVPLEYLTACKADGFYGTYFSKAKRFSAVPDTITWYDIPIESLTADGVEKDSLYDLEMFEKRDKYAAFIHSNNGLTVIRSAYPQRGPGTESSRVLLIKDSFGNSFAPFLLCNYKEVAVIDLRYFTGLAEYLNENKFDDIYILYSFNSFSQETSIANLRR